MIDRQKQTQIVLFTVAITAFFGLLVTGLESALSEKRNMNEKVTNQRVVLQLFGLKPPQEEWDGEKILREYADKIEPVSTKDVQGRDLTYYRLKDPKAGKTFVVPFKGKGFWDTILGYMAIDVASQTMRKIDFTAHSETPGLGGRISEQSFKDRFVNLPLGATDDDGRRFHFVAEGTARKEHPIELDGLTGASETTRAVEHLLNEMVADFLKLMEKEGK